MRMLDRIIDGLLRAIWSLLIDGELMRSVAAAFTVKLILRASLAKQPCRYFTKTGASPSSEVWSTDASFNPTWIQPNPTSVLPSFRHRSVVDTDHFSY